ncbi:hypothetical protein LAYK6_14030 [Lactobacillus amylovorus subsp. amylovorus]|uniref:restriction endonuclease subunit S n=1 Tax=Lactobacillus amylovorus TaxID=1604 RepID=UPI0028500C2B|nr:hypothetical protein LAYK6_14030 [Lactobacillus amylovorus]
MNKKEVKKAPALRFKGFTNDWEQQSLKKIFTTITDYVANGSFASLRHNVKTYKKPNYAYLIRLMDASNNWNGPWLFTDKKGYDFLSKSSLKPKDILLSNVGAGVGKTFQVPRLDKPMTLAPNAILLRSNKLNNQFCFYLLKYPQNKNKVLSLVGVSAQPKLNKTDFGRLIFNIPNDRSEQDKISKILSKLDKIVNLQQRKLRLLKLLKKATQQNIFASTECLPKLKYRNLTEKWQLYRLKDVAKITMGQSPNSKNYTQNPIDHILVQGNADIRNGYVFPRIWTTEITKIASKGDIILCVRAPAGDVGRTKFNVVIGRGVAAIKGNDFIFQQLQFMKSSGYWKKYISGSTFESINSNDIKNAKIFCPSQLEQKNISSLLDDIDTSIQIQQKNILDFKYIKQFLLQNMFI